MENPKYLVINLSQIHFSKQIPQREVWNSFRLLASKLNANLRWVMDIKLGQLCFIPGKISDCNLWVGRILEYRKKDKWRGCV